MPTGIVSIDIVMVITKACHPLESTAQAEPGFCCKRLKRHQSGHYMGKHG